MRVKGLGAVLAVTATLAGCVPYYAGYEQQNLYAPGGALADKVEGPAVLATANENSLNAMFPKGTSKSVVMQALGSPKSTTSSTGGTSMQTFMYSFTSYARKSVEIRSLTVEYDKAEQVSKLTYSVSQSTW